jgi:hypothetical protein
VSDASSAGMAGEVVPGYGKTCRQDVLRGVVVPVVPGTAGWALPHPDLQTQVGEDIAARRARLGRRGTTGRRRSRAARAEPPCTRAFPGRSPTRSPRSPSPACGSGPCSSRRGPRWRSRHSPGPDWWRPCGGSRCGRRGLVRRPHDQKLYSIKSGYVTVTRREGVRRFFLGLKTGVSAPQKR